MLVYTNRSHSKVQIALKQILNYANIQRQTGVPASIMVTKNSTEAYHLDYIIETLESNGFKVNVSEGHNHINVYIEW